MLKGFKEFVLRGNVVDLAVGVVIGAAFGSVVTALVKDLLTPLIAAITKVPDFSGMVFHLNGSKFMYGDFINAFIAFLLVAAAVYFFVVVPMNALLARVKKGAEPEVNTKPCQFCKTEIAKDATRCPACTSQLQIT
jgi:large conductance mechanosensitive channel